MAELCQKSGNHLFSVLQATVLFVEDSGLISAINPFGLDFLGYKDSNIEGDHINAVIVQAQNISSDSPEQFFQALIGDKRSLIPIIMRDALGHEFEMSLTVGERIQGSDQIWRRLFIINDADDRSVKISKQNLKSSQLEVALAAIPDGFAIYDQDDRLEIFNKAYADIYSHSSDALKVGSKFEDVVKTGLANGQYDDAGQTPEEQNEWLNTRLQHHQNPGEPIVQRVGGRWIKVDERKLEDGRIAGIRTDITQLIENKTLAESLGDIMDNLAVAILFTCPRTKKFTYANKAALERLQYNSEEILQIGPEDIIADAQIHDIEKNWNYVRENRDEVLSIKSVHRRKDGTTYPCLVQIMSEPVKTPCRIITLIHDETEEEKIREELEFQRIEREAIFENLPACMTNSKLDTTMLYANQAYAEVLGIDKEKLIGMKFIDLVPTKVRPQVRENLSRLTVHNPIQSFEQPMTYPNGAPAVFIWTNRLIVKNGKPVSIISIGRDITETKSTQERIEQQAHELRLRNNALEQYAGIVSHDLRSPLRHIRMFGEILLDETSNNKYENLEEYVGKMRDGASRLDRMVTSLLEFSQLAYKEVNKSQFKLSKAFGEAIDNLQDDILFSKAVIKLRTEVELDLDFMLIVRLLQNLFDNSIKYKKHNVRPIINVSAEQDDNKTKIVVEDNGVGVPKEHTERVFNIFQRVQENTDVHPGTGIGLAIVKRIVEGHNGKVALDASYEDGLRVILTFPNINSSSSM